MLPLQSHNGRITQNGIRAVRQAVVTGEQVQRADVLAIIHIALEIQTPLPAEVAQLHPYRKPTGGGR